MMRFAVLSICFFLLPVTVLSQTVGLDADKPVEIAADSLEVQQKQNKAIFRGNVEAVQGNVRMRSDTMTVHYTQKASGSSSATGQGVERIEATGNVYFASPRETAKSNVAVYQVNRKLIQMTGNVVLTRDKNVLKGSKLVYNLATGKSVLSGGTTTKTGGQGGRVKGVFVPNSTQ